MKLPRIELIDRLNAEESLAGFVKMAWAILEPQTPLVWNWHLSLLCEYLEAVSAGDILRLIVNAPPRSMKSILVSVLWPVWSWVRHPETRWLFASYAQPLALKHSRDRRNVLLSDLFKRNWPGVRLKDDASRMGDFENNSQGTMRATSVGASVTGLGGLFITADDLINPQQANSEAERLNSLRWFNESLSTRLDDKRTGRIVVVEQRTHQSDLTGYLTANQSGWTVVSLPAEFERRTIYSSPSGKELVLEEGDILWPECEGRAELDAAKERIGSYAYQSQYLQNPGLRGGSLFQLEWLKEFHDLPAFDRKVMALDTAFSTKSTADYSAAVVVGYLAEADGSHPPGYYVVARPGLFR
jgi:hypothetical protein